MRKCISIVFVTVLLLFQTWATAAERIVILPFASLSKEDISFIQRVVPKLLATRLSEITGWDVVPAESDSAGEAAETYGPSYIVSGTVTKLGTTYSIDITVVDPGGMKTGGFFASAQDENGILAGLEALAKDVAGSLPGIAPEKEEVTRTEQKSAADVHAVDSIPADASLSETSARGEQTGEEEKHEGAPVVKESLSAIKKKNTLGKLPGEIYRVAASDIDGDGDIEIAFMGTHKLYIYRFSNGQIHPIKTFDRKKDHHFLNVDVYDVDGDGLEDFVITDLVSEFLRSFVVGKTDEPIGIKMNGISWYLAVFDDFRGDRVLVGQKLGAYSPYSDRAYVLSWNGKEFVKGESLRLPVNEGIITGVLNMNAFSEEKKQRFVFIDQYDKIRAADGDGDIFWKSSDYYSGAYDFFEIPSESIGADGRLTRHYVNSRLKKIPIKNKIAFLVREAPKPLLSDLRSYSESSLAIIEWDGDGFSKKLQSDDVPNLITDFSLFETGMGEYAVIAATIVSKESAFKKGMTRVELFSLD